ncbi:corrinoid protein [candidate division WOR-3 bacterium]|nr:corrinoid protein [candidate division WOR-3 bacterium]
MTQEKLFEEIKNAVLNMDVKEGARFAKLSIELNVNPNLTIEKGFVCGIQIVGELWEKGEFFIPEIIQAAEVVHSGIQILKSSIVKETLNPIGKVVIGTAEGDIHDIGKSLVATMLESAGFEIFDLGADVRIRKFIRKAKETSADIICISALLTTTMLSQKELINELIKNKIRDSFKIMVGGAPVTQDWAQEIGADGYAPNAMEAIKIAKKLLLK